MQYAQPTHAAVSAMWKRKEDRDPADRHEGRKPYAPDKRFPVFFRAQEVCQAFEPVFACVYSGEPWNHRAAGGGCPARGSDPEQAGMGTGAEGMPYMAVLYGAGDPMRNSEIEQWKKARTSMLLRRSDDYVRQLEVDAFRLALLKLDEADQMRIQNIVDRIAGKQNLGQISAVEIIAKFGIYLVGREERS